MKKIFMLIALVLTLAFALTGCSQNQQVIFDAAMNMQKVHSLQEQATFDFQLSGTGFEPGIQEQIDMAAMYVNNFKLDLDAKSVTNETGTVIKGQADINLELQGMSMNLPIWVDMDLDSDTPKMTEIFRLPVLARAELPLEYREKEYMVMDLGASNSEDFGVDVRKLMEFSKSFQEAQLVFLESYSKRFNPAFEVTGLGKQTVQTKDGAKEAEIYTIKLDDAQLKEFVRYTVNHFAEDVEAVEFVKQYLTAMMEMSLPEDAGTAAGLDTMFQEFEANKPQLLADFNAAMDQLDKVQILGEQGLEIEYAISGGYCIQTKGSVHFRLDMAQVSQGLADMYGTQNMEDAKGVLELQMNYKTDTYGINEPLEIEIPELNESNSFSYFDMLRSTMPLYQEPSYGIRLAGQDRYQTAAAIAEALNSGTCENIILASGEDVSGALAAGILSGKFKAPVLLVGSTVEESSAAFDYIAAHATPETKIFILGGSETISTTFETALTEKGNGNFERLSGSDRYETAMAVTNRVEAISGAPVFIVSGENYADALSVASFSGAYQYPVLLVKQDGISESVKTYIANKQPTDVYIIGGTASISESVEAQIRELAPGAALKRMGGNDCFETNAAVAAEFGSSPETVYVANGFSYADALAGSALAAQTGDPVLLVDYSQETLPPAVKAYLEKIRDEGNSPWIMIFGGQAVVPNILIFEVEMALAFG